MLLTAAYEMLLKLALFVAFIASITESAVTKKEEEEAFVVGLFNENPYYDKVNTV